MAVKSNNMNFEAVQIKNALIDKLANETKINEFIREYFGVSERRIFDVYEGIVNFFLRTDELGKFKDDFKVFVEEDSGFLLDKIFSGYAIDEFKLQELFLSKMKLKRDYFGHKGVYVFTRSIFQHGLAQDFFEALKLLNHNWKNGYITSLVKTLRTVVGSSVVNMLKEEVVKELILQTDGSSKRDIEENYSVIIEGMVNKRLIERNFGNIAFKMIEYFGKKKINLQYLIDKYDEFTNELLKLDLLSIIDAQYKERIKKSPLSSQFNKLLASKHQIIFKKEAKNQIFQELKNIVPEKTLKSFIELAEKSPLFFKQQLTCQIALEGIIRDLKIYEHEYKGLKERTISAEYFKQNLIKPSNIFYKNLSTLLKGYDKEEKNKKVNQIFKDVENSFDVNTLFDDIFLKIRKFEELKPFLQYENTEIFKQISEVAQNLFKSKGEKIHDIIEILKYNLKIMMHFGKLFNKQEHFITILRKKQIAYLKKYNLSVLDYLLQSKERLVYKANMQANIIGLKKITGDINQDISISQMPLAEYLLDIKDYAVAYDTSELIKKCVFVDKFFSPQGEEASYQLKNFLKIWLLVNHIGPISHISSVFLKDNKYLSELSKLYAFTTTLNTKNKFDFLQKRLHLLSEEQEEQERMRGEKGDIMLAKMKKGFNNIKFYAWWKNMKNISEIKHSTTDTLLGRMKEQVRIDDGLNSIAKDFLDFINNNYQTLKVIEDFDNFLNNPSEIDILYGIFYLINKPGVTVEAHNDYVLVYFRNKIFIFFANPNFSTFNNISLFLESKKEYEHIFIYTHVNFYLYLTGIFRRNINVKGMQQNFKQLLLLSFYDDDISDISIYGDKEANICYFLTRKKGKYHMLGYKKVNFVQTVFSFSVMDAVIENIIYMNGAITSDKQSDTSIKFGGINYRIGVIKDGNRIGIIMRKAQNAGLDVDIKKFMDENSLVYQNQALPYKKEGFSLYQTYDAEDVQVMLDYVAQTSGMIIISGSTGSGKSVSMRNFLNHVFEDTLKNNTWKKIATFEDPIEAGNPNFMQFEFKKEELPNAVLGIKRADLDVALVGEIRDYSMIAGMLEASDVIATKTTMHSPTVGNALFLLKKWAIAGKVDLVDIIYAIKILMAQKLSFYLKESYHSKEAQDYQVSLGTILPVYPNSKEEYEIMNDLNFLTRGTLGKDINYETLKDAWEKDPSSVTEHQAKVLHTEKLSQYLFSELIKKQVLKYTLKDAVVRRKVYYEMIDRVKMKLEFNLMYSVLTGDNIIGRPIREDEADINKLMIKLLRKTREQRALEDFLRGYMDWKNLTQYSKEYFILVLLQMFEKNQVYTEADVDKFIEKLINNQNIL